MNCFTIGQGELDKSMRSSVDQSLKEAEHTRTHLVVERLGDEHEGARADLAERLLVDEVERRLVDETDVQALLPGTGGLAILT